jgi:hypothetical protein
MNSKITELVTQSIDTLKTTLLADELVQIKTMLTSIYEYKISTSQGWHKIETAGQISTDKLELIENSFYDIGFLICIPSRGTANILRDTYREDNTSPDKIPFEEYQWEVMGYVHDQVDKAF